MAEISSGRSHLDLWWPTTLPAPRVAGATATYRNVLPGVTLVLTATSQAAGGFNEVLVVSSAAAAHRVARLKMRVTGVRLSSVKGGGLSAPFPGGAFVSSPARMWDSSSMTGGRAAVRTARAAALQVGAELVPPRPSVSSAAAPASGARIAPLGATVSGQGRLLALVPDGRMLASQTSRFPIFYDPDFTTTGSKQDYDPVQSECTSSHWNSSSYTYSPVGYDNWGSSCANDDTDRALYRVAMPTQTAGSDKGDSLISSTTTADLLSANFQVNEVYSSDCSSSPTVSVSWIGAISSSTGWPGPNPVTGEKDATSTVKYDSGSCDNTVDYGNTVAASFNVLGDITAASEFRHEHDVPALGERQHQRGRPQAVLRQPGPADHLHRHAERTVEPLGIDGQQRLGRPGLRHNRPEGQRQRVRPAAHGEVRLQRRSVPMGQVHHRRHQHDHRPVQVLDRDNVGDQGQRFGRHVLGHRPAEPVSDVGICR